MEQAENILQELPCGCAIFNEAGIVIFVNRTLCSVLGYQPEQILGQNLETVLTISSRIFHQTHFFPLLKLKGEVSEIFLTLKAKSGDSIPTMANGKVLKENGQSSYICVFAPVWERQKYEDQLLEINRAQQKALEENAMLNRLKNELELNQYELDRKISMLRERSQEYLQLGKVFMHDMQEPIRKISVFVDLFLRKVDSPLHGDNQRYVAIIKKSIQRLTFLMGSMLEFVQVGNAADPVTSLNPGELIRQAIAKLVKDQNLFELNVEIGELPEFDGRAIQIKQVFFELLKNAVANRHPDRELLVKVTAVVSKENAYQNHLSKYRYTDHIKIEFADNGTGFDNHLNNYVFGLLNKLNADTTGLGLGLALCKQIISNHYGTIKARSAPGEGTTIVIVLPLHQVPEYS